MTKSDFKIGMRTKVDIKFKDFKLAKEQILQEIGKTLKQNIINESPSSLVNNSIYIKANKSKGKIDIGWEDNTQASLVANVLEFGSGERGKYGGSYSQYAKHQGSWSGHRSAFTDSADYTIPIVPTHSKAMKFQGVGKDGKRKTIYMKEFKGHRPRYIMTNALEKTQPMIDRIINDILSKP